MSKFTLSIVAFFFAVLSINAQDKTTPVSSFKKIIISPHIEAIFQKGESSSVTIENAKLDIDKINIEEKGKTLRIYLDGAKELTENQKIKQNGWEKKVPLYNETMATVIITYTDMEEVSIRGEEVIRFKSPLEQNELNLIIYGESKVYLEEVNLQELHVAIYGDSYLEIKKGEITSSRYRTYGASEINATEPTTNKTRIAAYGDNNIRVHVSDKLIVSAFGEANVIYSGNPSVQRKLIIGDAVIRQIN